MRPATMETRSRVLAAFRELRKRGLLARANYMCCQSCAGYALAQRASDLKTAGKEIVGVVFWHRQDDEYFRRSGRLYLAYGDVETREHGPIGMDTASVGRLVVETLERHGLAVTWDGDPGRRILVTGCKEDEDHD